MRFQITSTLDNLPVTQTDVQLQNGNVPANGSANGSINGNKFSPNGQNEEISIGSAGSLARRQSLWDEDLLSGKLNEHCGELNNLFTQGKTITITILNSRDMIAEEKCI